MVHEQREPAVALDIRGDVARLALGEARQVLLERARQAVEQAVVVVGDVGQKDFVLGIAIGVPESLPDAPAIGDPGLGEGARVLGEPHPIVVVDEQLEDAIVVEIGDLRVVRILAGPAGDTGRGSKQDVAGKIADADVVAEAGALLMFQDLELGGVAEVSPAPTNRPGRCA